MMKKYMVGPGRLKKAHLTGFRLSADGGALLYAGGEAGTVRFARLDGAQEGCPWGRIAFHAETAADTVFTVRTYASDTLALPSGAAPLESEMRAHPPGCRDLLLTGMHGRYLWVTLTAKGGPARFHGFRAYAPGENFLQTFPEVYREEGGFFHRYISIFSVLYGDLQERIDALDILLDPMQAQRELLPVYAEWFGLKALGDDIEEKRLRALLKNAYALIRKKGTREAVEAAVSILTDAPFYLIEQRQARGCGAAGALGADPFTCTLMLRCPPDEALHQRLLRVVRQLLPVRMDIRILFETGSPALDGVLGLDVGAALAVPKEGVLDAGILLDETGYLSGIAMDEKEVRANNDGK